jgi:antitoxin component YwqK of YwqJK toxin-antitoxin module
MRLTYSKDQLASIKNWYSDSSQLYLERNYHMGERDGLWTYWHANGVVKETTNYDNGILHGNSSIYDDQGNPLTSKTYEYGELRHEEGWLYHVSATTYYELFFEVGHLGTVIPDWEINKSWDENGDLRSESENKNGKLDGVFRTYQDGVLVSEKYYSQGLLHGLDKVFSFENAGVLSTQSSNLYGKLDGEKLVYNPANGILIERSNYKDDKLHGLRELFNADNGNPTFSGEYVRGLRTGLHTTWNTDGSILLSEITYQDDILNGPYRLNRPTGVLHIEGNYTDGLKNGTFSYYTFDGKLEYIIQYQADFRHGVYEVYNTSYNEVTERSHYRGGLLHGLHEVYHISSSSYYLAKKSEYEDDLEVGPIIICYENGTVQSHTPLIFGKAEGAVLNYNEAGVLVSETTYKAGIRHGSVNNWDQTGKLVSTGQNSNGVFCGIWTFQHYDVNGNFTHTSTLNRGSCQEIESDLNRGIQGNITADGSPVPNTNITLGGGGSAGSNSEGFYRIPLSSSIGGTSFTLTITHDDHPTKEFPITIPAQDGFVSRNFSLDAYNNPSLTLEEPSVAGIHFLEGVSLPLTIKGTVDWGDAPGGYKLKRTHGEYSEEFDGYSTFSLSFNPGTDSEESASGGTLVALLSGGETSNSVPLPDFKVVPHDWTSSIGSWRAELPKTPGDPGNYYLKNAWPENALNIGISQEIIGDALWYIWEEVPVVGGEKLGLFDVQFTVDAKIPTNGNGTVDFGGQAELILPIKSFRLDAKGTGKLQWTNNSLNLSEASVFLKGTGGVAIKAKAVKLLPALKTAYKIPLAGEFIQSLVDDLGVTINSKLSVGGVFPIDTTNGDILFAPSDVEFGFYMETDFSFSEFKLSHTGSLVGTWNLEGESAVMKELTLQNWVTAELSYKGWETFKETTGYSFTFPDGTETSAKANNHPIDFIPKLIDPDFLHFGNYAQLQSARAETVFSSQRSKQTSDSQLLINNIYPDANPVLADHNGTRALAYIHYDSARPEGQSTRLYVAFDTGSGFEPAALVHTEARADFNPQLSFLSDGRLIAVWETSILDQIATTLDERITGLEIAWAIYDPDSKTWSNPVLLSDNTYLDHNPILADSSQGPMLVWRSNVSSELLATAGFPDQVNFTTWNGSSFSTPAALPYDLFPLGSISLAYDGTQAVFTWIHDEDTDIGTAEDRELYWADYDGTVWTNPIRATNDQTKDHNPRVFCLENGNFELVWAKDESLVRMDNFQTLGHQVLFDLASSHYDLACDSFGRIALLWTDYNDSQMDLRYALIDTKSGTQSDELYLTHDVGYEKAPSFTLNDQGEIAAVYLSQKVDSEQHDLYILNHSLGIDLAVNSPTFVPSIDTPGEFEITAELMNLGDLTANNAGVEFYLGDPDNGGALLDSSSITLHGGNQTYTTFKTSGIQPADNGQIYVRIDPANAVAETDESNNTANSSLFLRDLDDDDGDGIPDVWEMDKFEDLDEDGSGDQDKDGFSDLYEYLTLTNPNNAASNFKYSIEPDPSVEGNYLISFPTVNGRTYRIQWAKNLSNWFDHSFNDGTGSVLSISVPGVVEGSQLKFFRIRIEEL